MSSDKAALTLFMPCKRIPLYENQEPDFSIMPLLTARLAISASYEIPLPNMISNVHSLNGGATLFLTIRALVRLPTISLPVFMLSILRYQYE